MDYDISAAFEAIENELIASMIRNMDRHRAEETAEGIEWSQWQTEQLKALEKYKSENAKKYGKQFADINNQIDALISNARIQGGMEQEIAILKAMKKGFTTEKISGTMTGQFFRMNDKKMEALIKATTNDMKKAETAILRHANDQYRKTIFNAQVYANSGAGTYEKAVDMATKDMLAAGLNCIEYKNGARHTLSDYADMAIKTANKRAYLTGEGEKRKEWGISTVIMNKRGNPCPLCLFWVEKILIDDIWSGGSTKDGDYPLMSTAVAAGLYHPRCQDSHSTYFEDITDPPDKVFTRKEVDDILANNKREQDQQYAKRQAEKFERLKKYSLDKQNKELYGRREEIWKEKVDSFGQSDTIELGEWTKEAIESRRQDEAIIAGYKTEHAILYDSRGNRLFKKRGGEHSVSFTQTEVNQMRGGVLTHNHPRGATFSGTDIYMLKEAKLGEIRAVGRDGAYVLKQPKTWPEEIDTLGKIEKEYKKIEDSISKEMNALYSKSPMPIADYNIMYQDKIIKEFTNKFGLEYKMEELR